MSEIASFRAVIELWPSREALASEIGARSSAVSKWWQRDRIPSEYWLAVLGSPKAQAARLSSELLADLAARDRERCA